MSKNYSKLVKSILFTGVVGLSSLVSGCKDKAKVPSNEQRTSYGYKTDYGTLYHSLEGKTPTLRRLNGQEGTEYKSHSY